MLDLFQAERPTQNLLPNDGFVAYHGQVFSPIEADRFEKKLGGTLNWQNDQAIIYGKLITTKRKVAWYGDQPYDYKYSNITKKAIFWTPELLAIKLHIEQLTNETFNSCLANLYHDGTEGMAYHADGEKDLKKHGAIASVSFGAERFFHFKHKETKERIAIFLQHGSLLMMKDQTQDHWLHRLPPSTKIKKPRINLTFRTIDQ
jgi:alkylated DNA repair dioxygenase AlkB